MFDYETLKLFWWVLIGVLLIGFAVTDGFDMGIGALLPWIAKTDSERRVLINTVGPHWDGNQVWFITAGGALFAAWPLVYAIAFSSLYWALLLVLFALFFRPVGFEYRSKIENPMWRSFWDWGLFAGGAVPSLVFGVAFGNIFQGIPFEINELMQSSYHGSFWQLLNPFALLCGIISLSMLMMHGGLYAALRTEGSIHLRAKQAAQIAAGIAFVSFILAGFWVSTLNGYVLSPNFVPGAVQTPGSIEVIRETGAWLNLYDQQPLMWLLPAVTCVLLGLLIFLSKSKASGWAFLCSSVAIAGIIMTAGFSLFPFVLPSSASPADSLTLWNAVSSEKTLGLMLVAAFIFVPIILCYTLWGYFKLWGIVTAEAIEQHPTGHY